MKGRTRLRLDRRLAELRALRLSRGLADLPPRPGLFRRFFRAVWEWFRFHLQGGHHG